MSDSVIQSWRRELEKGYESSPERVMRLKEVFLCWGSKGEGLVPWS